MKKSAKEELKRMAEECAWYVKEYGASVSEVVEDYWYSSGRIPKGCDIYDLLDEVEKLVY